MKLSNLILKNKLSILVVIAVFFGLYQSSQYNYLLFHSIVEIFSVVIAGAIFIFAWNSRRMIENDYFMIIGIAYLFVAGIDFLHAMSYKGMPIFIGGGSDLPTQLWIVARYVESFGILFALLMIRRRVNIGLVFSIYIATVSLLLLSIFYWHIFPSCFIEGQGLTTFKVGSEYVISTILLASAFLLWRSRAKFDPGVFRLLLSAIIITIASEMSFTLYTDVYGIANAVGHYLKIISFYLIYKAIIESGLTKPYAILFKDLKDKEEIIQKSAGRYRELVNNIPDAIFSSLPDENTSIVFMSDRWLDWTGCPPELLYQDPQVWQESVLPEDREVAVKHYMEGAKQGREYTLEYRVVHKDSGHIRYLYEHGVPIIDREGNIVRLDGIITDITERKRMEEALRESEKKYHDLLDNANDLIQYVGPDGRIIFVNKKWLETLEYSEEEVKNLKVTDILHENQIARIMGLFKGTATGGTVKNIEATFISKYGKELYVEGNGSGVIKDGEFTGAIGIFRDITERKKTEEVLRKSEERFRTIFDIASDGVLLADLETQKFHIGNTVISQMTGYSLEEIKDLGVTDIHPKEDLPYALEQFDRQAKGEITLATDIPLRRKDGSVFYADINSAPITLAGKTYLLGSFRDITERKRADEKIKASLAEKELLLKEVHHRVKNNMQVISSLLKLGAGSVKNKEDAVVFKDSQDRIKSMALVYNKLYQAEDLAHIDFGEYVRELVNGLAHSYKAVSGKVVTSVEGGGVPLGVDQAIPCGLVINELITNSLKYAFPKGRGGEIRVFLGESEDEVELTVSDDGVGIPASLDLANSKTLGLHLVGNLVEQLGGKIELDRTVGTRFRITFRKNQE